MASKHRDTKPSQNALDTTDYVQHADYIKNLVRQVRSLGINKSNDEIVKVLECCHYDVDCTILNFCKDGGQEMLSSWQCPREAKAKKQKQKQRQKQKRELVYNAAKENGTNGSMACAAVCNGVNHPEKPSESLNEVKKESETDKNFIPKDFDEDLSLHMESDSTDNMLSPSTSTPLPPPTTSPPPPLTSSPPPPAASSPAPNSVNNEGSNRRPSTSGIKEIGKKDIQRTNTDLKRLSSALAKVDTNLKSEMERSYNQIRKVFAELRAKIQCREEELKKEMEKVEKDANELLTMRKQSLLASQQQSAKSTYMSVDEFKTFRQDVKILIGDRNLDEDLGSGIRFEYYKIKFDDLLRSIQEFGEVKPVKNKYAQKRTISVSSTNSLQVDIEVNSSVDDTPAASSPSSVTSSLSGISSIATDKSSPTSPENPVKEQNLDSNPRRHMFHGGSGPRRPNTGYHRRNQYYNSRGQGGRWNNPRGGRGYSQRGFYNNPNAYRNSFNDEKNPSQSSSAYFNQNV